LVHTELEEQCDLLFAEQRYTEALALCDQILAADGSAAIWYGKRGTILAFLDRHEEALAAYEQLCILDPTDAAAWMSRANTLRVLGRGEEALAACDNALQINPPTEILVALIQYTKGEVLQESGLFAEAYAAYTEALHLVRMGYPGEESEQQSLALLLPLLYTAMASVLSALGEHRALMILCDQACAFGHNEEINAFREQAIRAL
jgi:tetratricopeptide (TPR) repeat protein